MQELEKKPSQEEIKIAQQKIAVLDYGSQYSSNILKNLRRESFNAEVFPHDFSAAELKEKIINNEIKGIIISGGPNSVYDEKSPKIPAEIYDFGIPVLGICYGMQAMARELGGEVSQEEHSGEFGETELEINKESELYSGISTSTVIMSHGDSVTKLPEGFTTMASSKNTAIAAFANPQKKLYGVQYHPEVTQGHEKYIANFARKCGLQNSWDYSKFIQESCASIQKQVGERKVLLAISGGVDSTALALLLNRAIPNQTEFFFVDQGFMRKNEVEEISESFKRLSLNVNIIDASENFLNAIAGETDPEKKRKKIGAKFIEVFESETSKLQEAKKNVKILAQGTLCSDVMESGGLKIAKNGEVITDTIKSHHNVGGLPEKLGLELLEPFRNLFKDEVREVAKELAMPADLIARPPFPGPGLAIRVPNAEVTQERLNIIKEADAIFRETAAKSKNSDQVWQPLAALLTQSLIAKENDLATEISELKTAQDIKAKGYKILAAKQNIKVVGTKGDARSHDYPITIKILKADGTAASLKDNPDFNMKNLRKLAAEITNKYTATRVLYEISNTSKNPESSRAIVMRSVNSIDAMTATATDLLDIIENAAEKISHKLDELKLSVAGNYYDLTDKPPGTIEFE